MSLPTALFKSLVRIKRDLKEDIDAVFNRDPAARNSLEVILTYPGIHALVLHRGAHYLLSALLLLESVPALQRPHRGRRGG